jgi:hypothetical protein
MKAILNIDYLFFGSGLDREKAVYGDEITVRERPVGYACKYIGTFRGQEKILHAKEIKLIN